METVKKGDVKSAHAEKMAKNDEIGISGLNFHANNLRIHKHISHLDQRSKESIL